MPVAERRAVPPCVAVAPGACAVRALADRGSGAADMAARPRCLRPQSSVSLLCTWVQCEHHACMHTCITGITYPLNINKVHMLMRDMREEKDAISLSLNFLNDDLRSGIVTRKMVERVLCELAQSSSLSPRHFAMAVWHGI